MWQRLTPGVLALAALGLCTVCMIGCTGGGSAGDGVSSQVKDDLSNASDLAQKVNGDYSKLKPDERSVFLKMANGNEEQAKKIVDMIAHPPNAGVKAAHANQGGS